MSAPDVLRRCREAGAQIGLDGEELVIRAPAGAVPDELVHELRTHKQIVVEYLRHPRTWPCDRCGRFAYGEPDVVCFWCRSAGRQGVRA